MLNATVASPEGEAVPPPSSKNNNSNNNNNATDSATNNHITTVEAFLKSLGPEFYDNYYPILAENKMTDLKYLLHCPTKLLEHLSTNILKMNFFEQIKFLSAVSEMKSKSQPKQLIVLMSDKENEILFGIKKKIETMHEIQTFLSNLVLKVDQNIERQCNAIDSTFDGIMNALQERKAALKHVLTHEWKNEKMKEIEKETQIVTQFDQLLKQELSKCEELLSNQSNAANYSRKQREKQMVAIADNMKRHKEFENYQNTNAMLNQLQRVSQCKRIQFQDGIDCKKISVFGSLQSSEIKLPELKLEELRGSERFDDHYHIEPVTFSIECDAREPSAIDSSMVELRRFVCGVSAERDRKSELDADNENHEVLDIGRLELIGNNRGHKKNSNDDAHNNGMVSDDSKEDNCIDIVDRGNNNTDDNALHLREYKCIFNDTSDANTNTNTNTIRKEYAFSYDLKYALVVVMNIEHPIHCQISSNPQCIYVPAPDIIPDIPIIDVKNKKDIQIPLNVHSHKGHYSDYVPERILKSDDAYYLSLLKQVRDDWIILSSQQNAHEKQMASMFYLTKVQVRHRGRGYSTVGDPHGLKSFRVWFGDVDADEWIAWNDEYFVTQKTDENLQTFHFPALDQNKWKQIYKNNKKWQHFKLEIKNNHGDSTFILIQEFKLFGVSV